MNLLKDKKLIIAFLIILSFSGCGGGGGGSSSSPQTKPDINIPNVEEKEYEIGFKALFSEDIKERFNFSDDKIVGIYGKDITFSGNLKINDLISQNDKGGSLNGYSVGLLSKNGNIINSGEIILSGDKVAGIYGKNNILNNGTIKTFEKTNNAIGIISDNGNLIKNNGIIDISAEKKAIGILSNNSKVINNNLIKVTSNSKAVGIYGTGKNSKIINNGKILINGKGYGIVVENGAVGRNNGEININGKGYGMYALSGGKAINEKNAIINLSSEANGAMMADGKNSLVENYGIINIDKNNTFIKKGEKLKAINGGRIINQGIINSVDKVVLNSESGVYTIGTDKSGNYGVIKSKDLEINGNIEIESEITKGSYKKEYTLNNVFGADNIQLNEINLYTDSLLYEAKIKKNDSKNINGKLIRNEKELTDFVGENLKNTAKIFTKYYNEKKYNSLDENSKEILDRININDEKLLNKNLEELTPFIYGNIQNQMKDIQDLFQENRLKSIKNLDKEMNFTLIENYSKINSNKNIFGYKNSTTGFLISKNLGNKNYLSLGYGYSDVKYTNNEDANIHSLNIGLDKIIKNENISCEMGLDFGYNYHKNNRKFDGQEIKSDFNSYMIGTYGKISKEYNEIIDIIPYVKLDLRYYTFDDFEENINNFIIKIEEENVVSVKPEIGIELEKIKDELKFNSKIGYSYEIGNNDKELSYIYKNIDTKNTINNRETKDNLSVKVGVSYEKEKILGELNFGKDFINKNSEFVELKFIYKF